MYMKTCSLIAAFTSILMFLAACSAHQSPVDVDNIFGLERHITDAGIGCDDPKPAETLLPGVVDMETCTESDVTIAVFDDSRYASQWAREISGFGAGASVSANSWAASSPDEAKIEQIHKSLGGTVFKSGEEE